MFPSLLKKLIITSDMQSRLLKFLLLFAIAAITGRANAQTPDNAAPADTIYNPPVIFSSMPRTYEIADIKVTGAPNYDDFLILGYLGLKVGDRVEIPGQDITNAVKRVMRQQLFSQARIKVLKTAGDKAWLELELRPQPRISQVNYNGMKKGEKDDLQQRLQLMKGNQITPNIVNRIKLITKKYFEDKGFGNADVNVVLREDLSNPNEMFVDINVDKHNKVKVHKIYIEGNHVLSDNKIQRTMKKTNEKNKLVNLFKQKKFVMQDLSASYRNITSWATATHASSAIAWHVTTTRPSTSTSPSTRARNTTSATSPGWATPSIPTRCSRAILT